MPTRPNRTIHLAAVATLSLMASACQPHTSAVPAKAAMPEADLLARGEYLVKIAGCNDCHTPHDFFGKYLTKAINGHNHSVAFTLGGFHEPIQITPRNHAITEEACRRCHADIVQAIDRTPAHGSELSCTNCHRNAGHPH